MSASVFEFAFCLLRFSAPWLLMLLVSAAIAQTTISYEKERLKHTIVVSDLHPEDYPFDEDVAYRMPPLPVSASVSGRIYTEIGTAIPSTTIQLFGTDEGSQTTANDGSYYFNLDPEGNYAVVPNKSNDTMLSNGISTIDLLLIRKHILSTNPLSSPYRIIAGDVDGSGSLTTIDYLLVRSVILRTINTFPHGKIWVFVKSDFAFSDPQNPFPYQDFRIYNNAINDYQEQDFIGIKLGDVNNTWDPNTPKMNTVGEIQLTMDQVNANPNQEIIIPVKVKDFNNISGYQFTISWNPEVISLMDVNNKTLSGYYGLEKIADGHITTTWNDDLGRAISLDDDEMVFELKFKVTGIAGDYSEVKIGSDITASEAYNESFDLLEINAANGIVKVEEVSPVVNHQLAVINLKVSPNPFDKATTITFSIEGEEKVNIFIYDLQGKKVSESNGAFKSGTHQINLDADNVKGLSNGIYYVRITAGEASAGAKIIRAN